MTSVKPTRTVRRGRLFPEIQWSEEKKAQWQAEREAFYQRCKPTFDRLKPELIKTHYNWYMAVEPDSGDYFIDNDDMVATKMCRQKHPNAIPFMFRINNTGLWHDMIQGTFGDEDELFFEVDLIADNGLELPVDALLDTGFSGWLAMDIQDSQGLNWTYVRRQKMITARGEFNFDLYAGKIRIENQEFDIPVHVGDGGPEVLIGRQWLKNRRLVVDMSAGVLTLEVN